MRKSNPFLKNLDPVELGSRYSNENRINYEDMRNSDIVFKDIVPFLELLPVREVDLLELYYKFGKNQKDIAKMFGVTQGAISSRISIAKKRLEFLRDLPKLGDSELDDVLGNHFESIEIDIIKCMIMTTCQSKTAEMINRKFGLRDNKKRMTQVKVRHRFEKCLNILAEMKKTKPEMAKYFNLLDFIKKNLYKLHEVKLPHFDRGRYEVFSMSQ